MIEHGMYFGKSEFYQIIRDNGGSWNDSKERIQKFMQYNKKDIRSCFYHIGNTNEKSIFFISDVVLFQLIPPIEEPIITV